MANQWFRLYSEFMADPKIQMMAEHDQRRFVMLLCMKCNTDATLQDEDAAFQMRISNDEWLKTKQIFLSKNLINQQNEPTNWNKRQYKSDSSTERSKLCREKKKSPEEDSATSLQRRCNVAATPPEQNRTEQIQNRTDKSFGVSHARKQTGTDEAKRIAEKYLSEATAMATS